MSEALAPAQLTKEGFEILCLWARNIAMLPLEEWKEAFELADNSMHIVDPTLYREFLYSEKAQLIVKMIDAALPLKKLVLEAQPLAQAEMEKLRETRPRKKYE
jgi:hypothetical protein